MEWLAAFSSGTGKVGAAIYRAVGLRLLGKLIDIPEAFLDAKAQSIRDLAAARSAIAKAATDHAIANGMANPELWGITTELLLGEFERKLTNKAAVFRMAIQHTNNAEPNAGDAATSFAEPSDDWLNVFARHAEDASSEKLRDLYARILAGEIRKSGSFSIATIRVMSELTQEMADAFSKVHADSIGGYLVDQEKYSTGDDLMKLTRLIDGGFITSQNLNISAIKAEGVTDNKFDTFVLNMDVGFRVIYKILKPGNLHIPFTPGIGVRIYTEMGRQIASLLPQPDLDANLRRLAAELDKGSIKSIQLRLPGKEEILFEADDGAFDS